MIATNPQRHRLQELINFAAAYRGWTARQLGDALQRDPSSVVPESGTPKVDLVVRLADALDWPVGDLLEHLSEPTIERTLTGSAPEQHPARARRSPASVKESPPDTADGHSTSSDTERLSSLHACLDRGDHDQAIELGDDLERTATPPVRARACLVQATALDRRGRPMRALAALQRGVGHAACDPALRLILMSRLADSYHRTGQPVEAAAIAGEVIIGTGGLNVGVARDRNAREVTIAIALAHATRGACLRDRALEADPAAATDHEHLALAATDELDRAGSWLEPLDDPDANELRLVVEAGRRAIAVCIGEITVAEYLGQTILRLDGAIDPTLIEDRTALRGLAWDCVLAGAVAVRHLPDGPSLHRTLAILTNKADEIAALVHCWALRERVLILEHDRRLRLAAFAGQSDPWLLDRQDLRMVLGCMGSSRRFRPLGVRILRSAVLVADSPADARGVDAVHRPRADAQQSRTGGRRA